MFLNRSIFKCKIKQVSVLGITFLFQPVVEKVHFPVELHFGEKAIFKIDHPDYFKWLLELFTRTDSLNGTCYDKFLHQI